MSSYSIPSTDTAPTASSTNLVTSGGVYSALTLKADLDSPALTGTPTAPNAVAGTDTTQIATTAFVQDAIRSSVVTPEVNYLDNWYFVPYRTNLNMFPINLRGKTGYNTTSHAFDRWDFYTNSTGADAGISFDVYGLYFEKGPYSNSKLAYMEQITTHYFPPSTQMTFSIWAYDWNGTIASGSSPYIGVYYIRPSDNAFVLIDKKSFYSGLISLTFTTPALSDSSNHCRLAVRIGTFQSGYNGTYAFGIRACKLEFGPSSTLTINPDSPQTRTLKDFPDFFTEVQKCQHYAVDLSKPNLLTTTNSYQYIGIGTAFDSTSGVIKCTLPQTMIGEVNELVTSGTFYLMDSGPTPIEVTSISLKGSYGNTVFVDVQVASGLTANQVYYLFGGESSVKFLVSSAPNLHSV